MNHRGCEVCLQNHLLNHFCEQYRSIEAVKVTFFIIFFQDLGLGKFCCPRGNGQHNVCCNTDPNPPPSTAAPVDSDGKFQRYLRGGDPSKTSIVKYVTPLQIFINFQAMVTRDMGKYTRKRVKQSLN